MKRIVVLFTGALLLAACAVAQEYTPQEKMRSFTFTEHAPGPAMNFFFQNDQDRQARTAFYMAEMTAGGDLVTNAPYTATAVEETTQVLGDGNRIVNKSSDFVARDSQGRTRRETTLHRIGNMQVDSKMVFISDPAAHTQYILQPSGDATKVVKSEAGWNQGPNIIELHSQHSSTIRTKISSAGVNVRTANPDNAELTKHEDLGTQTIEGVSAEGKRDTVTIPAGQIGNEHAIEIVSETWYSPELKTMVVRKHSDPRVGETTFRLTNIQRTEPDAALFQPPPGTKLKIEPLIELKRDSVPPKD